MSPDDIRAAGQLVRAVRAFALVLQDVDGALPMPPFRATPEPDADTWCVQWYAVGQEVRCLTCSLTEAEARQVADALNAPAVVTALRTGGL